MATSGDCSVSLIEVAWIKRAGWGDLPMGEGDFVVEAFDGDLDASFIGEFLRLPHAFITSKLVLR